jgi:hypothetical protein
MSNYRTITVRLVTQCKNQLYANSTTLKRLPLNDKAVSMNTPARAVKNTNRIQKMSATGKPARPP